MTAELSKISKRAYQDTALLMSPPAATSATNALGVGILFPGILELGAPVLKWLGNLVHHLGLTCKLLGGARERLDLDEIALLQSLEGCCCWPELPAGTLSSWLLHLFHCGSTTSGPPASARRCHSGVSVDVMQW